MLSAAEGLTYLRQSLLLWVAWEVHDEFAVGRCSTPGCVLRGLGELKGWGQAQQAARAVVALCACPAGAAGFVVLASALQARGDLGSV